MLLSAWRLMLCAAFSIIVLIAVVSVAQTAQEPLNSEWLKLDIKLIKQAREFLPPDDNKFKTLMDFLDPSFHESRDIGFGSKRHIFQVGGGYSRLIFTVLEHKGALAAMRIRCTAPLDWPLIKDAVMEAWGQLPAEPLPDGFQYEYIDSKTYQAMFDAVEDELGSLSPATIKGEFKKPYLLLVDPFEDYDYGESCYRSGAAPKGRTAIKRLLAGKQRALIRGVLISANPEGRLYAVEALRALADEGALLTEEEKLAIEKILAMHTMIKTCNGCTVYSASAGELLNTPSPAE